MSSFSQHLLPLNPKTRARRPGGRWILPLVGGLVAFEILAFGGVYVWVWVPTTLIAIAATSYLALASTLRRRRLVWDPLLFPVLGFGALVLLQWLAGWTSYPGATLTGWLQLIAPALVLYLSVCAFRRASNYRRLALAAWWFTGFLAIEAIVQHFNSPGLIYGYRDASYATPVGPFYYHNHFAGCMELLLPLAVAGALAPLSKPRTSWQPIALRCLIPFLGLCAVIVANSRGGLLCLGAEVVASLVLFRRQAARHLGATIAGLALVFAFTLLANWQPVIVRLRSLSGAGEISLRDRILLSRSALAIWRDHPIVGSGFNTFASVYPRHALFDTGKQVLEAHDEYAQALAETGAVGLGLALGFLVLLAAGYRAGQALPANARFVRSAALVGLFGFLIHCAGDFQFHAPANALLFFVCAAVVAGQPATARVRSAPEPAVTHLPA